MGRAVSDQVRRSRIQLYSRLKMKNIFPGEQESIYTGEGIEFSTIKPFEPGDDLRDLDLAALVQSGEEEIIQRVVGRQMQVYAWADLSGSMQVQEQALFPHKRETRDNAIGLLLFSAWNAYCPAGLCGFQNDVVRFFPARPGESYCVEMMDWLLDQGQRPIQADLSKALSHLLDKVHPQSLVFLISDYDDLAWGDLRDLFEQAAKKFDLVPIVICDPLETHAVVDTPVLLSVTDDERGGRGSLYLDRRRLADIHAHTRNRLERLAEYFRGLGINHVVLDSPALDDCYRALSIFCQSRRRMAR
jgi:uncharacterized protein (DUF58 family)